MCAPLAIYHTPNSSWARPKRNEAFHESMNDSSGPLYNYPQSRGLIKNC